MKESLKLIGQTNPQPEIKKHSESANWEYRDQAQFLYTIGSEMMSRFFNGLIYPDGRKVPNPLFAFDDARNNNVLGYYDLRPDEYGLMYKITINTAHFEDVDGRKDYKFGKWALCEVALHEMVHVWQQHGGGKDPYKKGKNTHNAEFVGKAKQLGLNVMPNVGCHTAPADEGSPFAILMHEMGIPRPTDVPTVEGTRGRKFDWFEIGKKEKGRSSLDKWSCGCQNARIGAKDFFAICTRCGNPFIKIETQATAMLSLSFEPEKKEPKEDPDLDEAIRRQMEEGYRSNEQAEDLSTNLEPYQKDYGDV